MRYRKIRAKHPGKCSTCDGEILAGQSIYWARGKAAYHVDCETARLQALGCTTCNGLGVLWNNRPCQACDGTGSRRVQSLPRWSEKAAS